MAQTTRLDASFGPSFDVATLWGFVGGGGGRRRCRACGAVEVEVEGGSGRSGGGRSSQWWQRWR